jgi:hypothetical protein
MSLQPVVLFVHLLGAVVLLAGSLYGPLVRGAIRRADGAAAVRAWVRYAHDAARATPIAALAVVVSGVYLARGRWSEPWLVVSLFVFAASATLSLAIVETTLRRIGKLAAADGPVSDAVERLRASAGWELGADAQLANDLALLFLMVQQPPLAGSLAVVLLANAAALGYPLLRRRHAAGAALATHGSR